ncbi:GGDEF domain-containing protein [Arcobacter sp. LA11]|uniref:GGDEF domain-containing protein n=1 Tax=Arcobacter sp. LA11 TaxID=1898176 RepID=UPI000934C2E6|nr:diguanylate cyclase [Arcobacter sp. LA11]
MNNKPSYEELESKIESLETTLLVLDSLKENIKVNDSFLKMLFDIIPSPMFYKDTYGVYQHCNDAFSKTILGISKDEILGRTLYDLPHVIPKEHADIYYEKDKELFSNPGVQFYETKVKCADGQIRYYNLYKSTFVIDGKVLGLVGIMLDVSEYKKTVNELDEKNKILNSLSITDYLTGLHNRRYFEEIFEKKISLLDRHDHQFSLALIDIDFFKDYNDCFGHQAGDEALFSVGKVLKETFHRPSDYIFRLGGEEFGILFDVKSNKDSYSLIEKLRQNVENAKLESCNNEVSPYLTVSIGLVNVNSIKKNDTLSSKRIYNLVDKLLYKSKENGRNKTTYEDIKE